MSKKKLLLVDLQEDQAKKVAKAITNSKCRKILDLLADKDYTATELSKLMSLPLSTVHYNLSILVDSGLVVADEFHYSEKMKEVLHYKLANQYILIGTKQSESFSLKEKLLNLLPSVGLVGGVGLVAHFFNKYFWTFFRGSDVMVLSASVESAEVMRAFDSSVQEVVVSEPNLWVWFFLGALFFSLVYLLFEYLKFLWRRSR